MAKETGTAAGYQDLFNKLHTFLTTVCGWTSLEYTAGLTMSVRGPGTGPGREVFVNIRTDEDPARSAYGWQLFGAIDYDAEFEFEAQAGAGGGSWFNTWQNTIDYWFFGNARRFIVVAKCGTSYLSAYCGFMLPYALPNEYPFPLYIAGNYSISAPYNVNDVSNRMITDSARNGAFLRARGNSEWLSSHNHTTGNTLAYDPRRSPNPGEFIVWPMRCSNNHQPDQGGFMYREFGDIVPNAQGEMPMWQCQIFDPNSRCFEGALEGVFVTPGFGRSAEQELTLGTRNFIVFQNVSRNAAIDYFAVEDI